jgi:hypothetical protein
MKTKLPRKLISGTRRKLAGAFGLLLALGLLVTSAVPAAAAMPTIGHMFYGVVTIDSSRLTYELVYMDIYYLEISPKTFTS